MYCHCIEAKDASLKNVLWLQLKLSIVSQYQRIPTRWRHYVEGFSYITRIRLNYFSLLLLLLLHILKAIPIRWQHYVKKYYFPTPASTTSTINSHQMARTLPPSPVLGLAQTDTKRRHNCFFPRSGVCSRVAPLSRGFPKNCIFFYLFLSFLLFSISFNVNRKTQYENQALRV